MIVFTTRYVRSIVFIVLELFKLWRMSRQCHRALLETTWQRSTWTTYAGYRILRISTFALIATHVNFCYIWGLIRIKRRIGLLRITATVYRETVFWVLWSNGWPPNIFICIFRTTNRLRIDWAHEIQILIKKRNCPAILTSKVVLDFVNELLTTKWSE